MAVARGATGPNKSAITASDASICSQSQRNWRRVTSVSSLRTCTPTNPRRDQRLGALTSQVIRDEGEDQDVRIERLPGGQPPRADQGGRSLEAAFEAHGNGRAPPPGSRRAHSGTTARHPALFPARSRTSACESRRRHPAPEPRAHYRISRRASAAPQCAVQLYIILSIGIPHDGISSRAWQCQPRGRPSRRLTDGCGGRLAPPPKPSRQVRGLTAAAQ